MAVVSSLLQPSKHLPMKPTIRLRAFLLGCSALLIAPSAHAATRIKQNNTDPLNQASSWDVLPGSADIAQWDVTVTGANSTVLGADLSWAGIKIVNPGTVPGTEPVTIGAGNTLTIGTSGIDMSTATQNLTLACGLTLQGGQSWKAAAGTTLDVAGTLTRTGASVDFTSFDATATLGTLTNDATGILGPWATAGSGTALQYVQSTAGAISAYAGATTDAGNLASVTSATTNYSYGAAATLGGSQTGNTLRYTGAATTTELGTNGLTLNGLINAGTGKLTINGTAANPGLVIGSSGELHINSNTQALEIKSNISGNGTVIFKSAGTITLSVTDSTNTYVGNTVINGGSVNFPAVSTPVAFFGAGPVTVNPGATLALGRTTLANNFTFNNATVTSGNSFASTLSGTITLSGNTTVNVTGNLNINGNLTGTGGLTKTGSAFVPLNGTNNDYTGPTIIGVNGGGLTIKSSLYGNDTAKWIPANITVNSGGALVMNVGGTGEFTIAQAGTMFAQLGGAVNNNGLRAGSIFGVDTRTSGGSFTISDNLTDSSGTGGGSVSFRYVGTGTTGNSTLELTGNNTYSGLTIVDRHGTIKVSSINSVDIADLDPNLPLPSSSLGRPTTVANGTIQLGSNASFLGGSLTYTGTGETTDRVVNFGGANNSIYRFDQSGSGLLKFTSNFTMTDLRGPQTVVLQGSTAGTGEMAGVLPAGAKDNSNRLTKDGSGTWTLSGANVYGGITTLTAGVLSVSTIADGGLTPTLTTVANNASVTASSTAGLAVGQYVISPRVPVGTTIASIVDGTTFTLSTGTGVTAGTAQVSTIGTPSNLGIAPATASFLVFNGGTLQYTGATASTNRNFTINTGKIATIDVTTNNLTLTGASTATNGALTKTGVGTLTLAGTNLYTGATTITQGTLALGANNVFANSAFSIGNATLDAATYTDSVGTLDVTDAATINLGSGAALEFANSSAVDWTGGSLNITTGTLGATSLRFGTDNTGLSAGQLAVISVNGTGTGTYILDASGYLVPGGSSPYDTWAAGTFANPPFSNTAKNVDFDNDGLSNLLEFVLGGDPTISQAGIAPKVSTSGGNLVVEFKRSDASEQAPAVTVKVELSTDLTFSTPAQDITIGAVSDPGPIAPSGASYTVSNSGGFDTIIVTIPQGGDPKKFARVSAVSP